MHESDSDVGREGARDAADPSAIPWGDLLPDPLLMRWLVDHHCGCAEPGCRALKIGCGLGDDAEELARCGWRVTAVDASETAIRWCCERFSGSSVEYVHSDLRQAPAAWDGAFRLVVDSYAYPEALLAQDPAVLRRLAGLLAPGGTLLLICRLREPGSQDSCSSALKEITERFAALGRQRGARHEFVDPVDPSVRRGALEFHAPGEEA